MTSKDKEKADRKKFAEDFLKKWEGGGLKPKSQSALDKTLKAQEDYLKKDSENPKLWFARGTLLKENGKFEKAIECFDAVIKLKPDHKGAWSAKADTLASLGRFEEAADCYKKVLEISSTDISEEYKQIVTEEKAVEKLLMEIIGDELDKKYRTELQRLNDKIGKNPRDADAWFAKAEVLNKMGNYKEALEMLHEVTRLDMKYPDVWRMKGDLFLKLGDAKKAVFSYERAHDLSEKGANCPLCGHQVDDDAFFCPNCGSEFDDGEEEEETEAQSPIEPEVASVLPREPEPVPIPFRKPEPAPTPIRRPEPAPLPVREQEPMPLKGPEHSPVPIRRPEPHPMPARRAEPVFAEPRHVQAQEAQRQVQTPAVPRPVPPRTAPSSRVEPLIPVTPKGEGLVSSAPHASKRIYEERAAGMVQTRAGMTNGATKEKAPGFINGHRQTPSDKVGRINGMINGRSQDQGRMLEAGIADRTRTGHVNGMVNGRGRIYGLINGTSSGAVPSRSASSTDEKGMINGIRALRGGLTNGLTNGTGMTNGLGYPQFSNRSRVNTWKVLVIPLVALVMLIPSVTMNFEPSGAHQGINVDGDFADWDGLQLPSAPYTALNPSIDIVNAAVEGDSDHLSFYVETRGPILRGGNEIVDTFHTFIDADMNPDTGYRARNIGSDYLITVYGKNGAVQRSFISRFNDSNGRDDWNGWGGMNDIPGSAQGSKLEFQLDWDNIGEEANAATVLFYAQSYDRQEDFSDYVVGSERGVLNIIQRSITAEVITGSDNPLLSLKLEAYGRDVELTELTVDLIGTASGNELTALKLQSQSGSTLDTKTPTSSRVVFALSEPLLLSKDQNEQLVVIADVAGSSGNTLGARIVSPKMAKVAEGIVSLEELRSSSSVGYVGAVPPGIVIDGGFSDWNGSSSDSDALPMQNPNVDIGSFDVVNSNGNMFFYLDVEGGILRGSLVPSWNLVTGEQMYSPISDGDRDTMPDEVDPYPYDFNNDLVTDGDSGFDVDADGIADYPYGEDYYLNCTIQNSTQFPAEFRGREVVVFIGPVTKPIVTGEDLTRIYVDTDNNTYTGFRLGALGIDRLLEIGGRDGIVTSKDVLAFSGDNWYDWNWTATGIATDLESGFAGLEGSADLGNQGGSTRLGTFIETTDWNGRRDDSGQMLTKSMTSDEGSRYYQERDQLSFGNGNDVGTTSSVAYAVATADFDNDGDADIVSGTFLSGQYRTVVWQNDGTPFSGLWNSNEVGVSEQVWSIAVADLDNNGYIDIITGNSSGNVSVWQNDGSPFTGTWTGNQVGPTAGTIRDVAIADFDKDGDIDIVSGSPSAEDYEIIVWQNDGTPFSGTWAQNDAGAVSDTVYCLAAADFDKDGDVDFASGIGSVESNNIKVWQNDGTPFSGLWTNNSVGDVSTYAMSIAAKDLDNDGDIDLATGDSNNEVYAWQNDGTPFSGTWTNNNVGSSNTYFRSVTIADFDNDGYADIASGSNENEDFEVIVWGNDWTPFSGTWVQNDAAALADDSMAVAAADFDKDGDMDIVTSCDSVEDNEVRIIENVLTHRNMPFESTGYNINGTDDHIYSVEPADLDNDGDLDLITGTNTAEDNEIIIWQNDGTPFTGLWNQNNVGAASNAVGSAIAADFDNDGDLDIAADVYFDVYVYMNDGTPFVGAWTSNLAGAGADFVADIDVADFDNDGDLDLVAVYDWDADYEVKLWQNDGTPFTDQWSKTDAGNVTSNPANEVSVGDFNSDGFMDFVEMSLNGELLVWQNDGSPFTGEWTSNGAGDSGDGGRLGKTADVDLDGDLDIITTGYTSSPWVYKVMVWQNDGSPFTGGWSSNDVGFPSANMYAIDPSDFDNDGDFDIVTGGSSSEDYEVITWQNDGTPFSGQWTQSDVGASSTAVYSIAAADLDNDGDKDIVSGSLSPLDYELIAWRNVGAQVNETVTDVSPSSMNRGSTEDLLRLQVTHNGISSDANVELKTLRFKFFKSDGSTALTASEMSDTFADYSLYRDDGDGAWNAGLDTLMSFTTSTSGNEVSFAIADGSSSAAVAQGTPRNFFVVVKVSGSASLVSSFKVNFDPDGYGSNDYNEVENTVTDRVVTVKESPSTMSQTVALMTLSSLSHLATGAGSDGGDRFGWNVSYAGDVNNDGKSDIIVGAPYNDTAYGAPANWWNTSWKYRRNVTFYNAEQAETFLNFTVMLKLNASNFDYSKAKSDGTDIRFIDQDGSTQLKYHIEKWNTSGPSYLWVNVSQIDGSSSADYIYLYYGNPSASDVLNPDGSYDSNFSAVWHLNETTGTQFDSTSNNNDGSPQGGITQGTAGWIDGANDLDAVNDYVNCGVSSSLNITQQITLEAWVKPLGIDHPAPDMNVINKYAGSGGRSYVLYANDDAGDADDWDFKLSSSGTTAEGVFHSANNVTNDQWQYIVGTWNGTTMKLYKNGVSIEDSTYGKEVAFSGPIYQSSTQVWIGNGSYYDEFQGLLDEVRISNKGRSADWVRAQFLSMINDFVRFGSEENVLNTGVAYIFFGYPGLNTSNINASNANVTIYGENAGDLFGWSVSDLGNVNAETKDDIIIGAPGAGQGKAYIFYGRTTWSSSYDASSADVIITGQGAGHGFGASVSGAGNMDGSGYNDIIIGANGYANTSWWNSNWAYRKKLTFDNSGQAESLNYLPVMVNLSASNFDYSKTKSDGTDLRFIDADDSTVLNHHFEKWNASGESYAWVNVTTIDGSSNSDYIWMYYGNPEAVDAKNLQGTYDNNFSAVWHLDETSGWALDSTSHANPGIPSPNVTQEATGRIDGADYFDGTYDEIIVPNHTSLNPPDNMTLEAWVKVDVLSSTLGRSQSFVSKRNSAAPWQSYEFILNGADNFVFGWTNSTGPNEYSGWNGPPTINTWYYIVGVKDGNTVRFYLNGGTAGCWTEIANGTMLQSNRDLKIGNDDTEVVNGTIDEVRLSNSARSANWIKAQYLSMTNAFITYGSEDVGKKGRAYVFYGDGSIPASAGSADKTYTGEAAADQFGFSVSGAGDVDNDGYDDVIIGAPFNDASGTNAGRAYIRYNSIVYAYVATNATTYGFISNFDNAKSASDGGANATLSEQVVNNATATTMTRRPNGNTATCSWDATCTYTKVNDQSDNTILSTNASGTWGAQALFEAEDSTTTMGVINFVDIYIRHKVMGTGGNNAHVRTHIKTQATDYYGTDIQPATSWGDSYTNYPTNPNTGSPWTWTQIDAIQIGVDGYKGTGRYPVVSEVWMVVNYTPQNYKMDLEFNTTNVAQGDSYALQLNYSTSGTETVFGVLVYNGTSTGWDDQAWQGDLSASSYTQKEYALNGSHWLGSGYVRVRFLGRNETSDSTNSTLSIEYHRIKVTGAALVLSGASANENFGWSVANVSDVNQDGSYDDVIVGAPGYGSATGRAYIFHGSSSMDSAADLVLSGGNPGDRFGFSVHAAGDIDGDGKPDVVVGAPNYDNGGLADAGIIYIYYGGSSMDSAADYMHPGDQAGAHFGWSVSLAGDMNADGGNDVVGGAPDYDDGARTDAGKAEVLYSVIIPEFSAAVIVAVILPYILLFIRRKRKRVRNH